MHGIVFNEITKQKYMSCKKSKCDTSTC